jgi:hypothetical protein
MKITVKHKRHSTKLCKYRWITFKLLEQVDGFILKVKFVYEVTNFKNV